MRPTNVRASVGSSASGSSARPIVSVPPAFAVGGRGASGAGGERAEAPRREHGESVRAAGANPVHLSPPDVCRRPPGVGPARA